MKNNKNKQKKRALIDDKLYKNLMSNKKEFNKLDNTDKCAILFKLVHDYQVIKKGKNSASNNLTDEEKPLSDEENSELQKIEKNISSIINNDKFKLEAVTGPLDRVIKNNHNIEKILPFIKQDDEEEYLEKEKFILDFISTLSELDLGIEKEKIFELTATKIEELNDNHQQFDDEIIPEEVMKSLKLNNDIGVIGKILKFLKELFNPKIYNKHENSLAKILVDFLEKKQKNITNNQKKRGRGNKNPKLEKYSNKKENAKELESHIQNKNPIQKKSNINKLKGRSKTLNEQDFQKIIIKENYSELDKKNGPELDEKSDSDSVFDAQEKAQLKDIIEYCETKGKLRELIENYEDFKKQKYNKDKKNNFTEKLKQFLKKESNFKKESNPENEANFENESNISVKSAKENDYKGMFERFLKRESNAENEPNISVEEKDYQKMLKELLTKDNSAVKPRKKKNYKKTPKKPLKGKNTAKENESKKNL